MLELDWLLSEQDVTTSGHAIPDATRTRRRSFPSSIVASSTQHSTVSSLGYVPTKTHNILTILSLLQDHPLARGKAWGRGKTALSLAGMIGPEKQAPIGQWDSPTDTGRAWIAIGLGSLYAR